MMHGTCRARPTTGVIFDLETNETVASGLATPHSPRWFGDALYALLSASGERIRVDINTGKHEVIVQLDGFVRGMDLYKDYLFIGLSKLRKNSSTFGKLKFAEKANQTDIVIIHISGWNSGTYLLKFTDSLPSILCY